MILEMLGIQFLKTFFILSAVIFISLRQIQEEAIDNLSCLSFLVVAHYWDNTTSVK